MQKLPATCEWSTNRWCCQQGLSPKQISLIYFQIARRKCQFNGSGMLSGLGPRLFFGNLIFEGYSLDWIKMTKLSRYQETVLQLLWSTCEKILQIRTCWYGELCQGLQAEVHTCSRATVWPAGQKIIVKKFKSPCNHRSYLTGFLSQRRQFWLKCVKMFLWKLLRKLLHYLPKITLHMTKKYNYKFLCSLQSHQGEA